MIDFKGITQRTQLYNFHSHTQFCDGRAAMHDFVVAAIEQGFTDYGFRPTLLLQLNRLAISSWRMCRSIWMNSNA